MLKLDCFPIFADHKTTLMETSRDDSGVAEIKYMTSSDRDAVNFDLVKRSYANALGLSEESAASVDALVQFADYIAFIEFKNGKVNNRKVKDKARDTLLIFFGITGETIAYSRENIDLIVVYNPEKNPLPRHLQKGRLQETPSRIKIAKHFAARAGGSIILFDLEKYKKLYFRDVRTYSKEEFESYLMSAE